MELQLFLQFMILVLHFSTNRELDKKIFNLVIEYTDIISHHCTESVTLFANLYPEAKSKVNIINHHGDYLIDFKQLSKEKARSKLNIPIEKFVILNFGSQQAYKGWEFIEQAFISCNVDSKYLLTAGNFYYRDLSFLKKLIMEIKNDNKVKHNYKDKKYIFRTINNDEIPILFSASDIVFLGHKKGLVSGILAMAATYSKPILFPEIGCFKEQIKDWTSLGFEPGNINQASNAIKDIYIKLQNNMINLDNSVWLEKNSWKRHVELILNSIKNFKKNKNTLLLK